MIAERFSITEAHQIFLHIIILEVLYILKMTNDWDYYSENLKDNSDYYLIQNVSDKAQKQIIAYCRKHSIKYDPIDDCVVVQCKNNQWIALIEWINDKDINCCL